MKAVTISNKLKWGVMALSVMLLCFTSACQEEESTLAETSQTYVELSAEVESLSAAMKRITDQYPEYRIDMQEVFQKPKEDITAHNFEAVITGVDNLTDKRKIATLHYQMQQLREKMFGLPDASGTYTAVDEQPTPGQGMQEFYNYIKQNLKYPAQARRMGIEGRVFVQFVVNTDGSIAEVKTLKGIGAGCDLEAERVMKEAAAWNPGRHEGQPVKVRMVLPISYRL